MERKLLFRAAVISLLLCSVLCLGPGCGSEDPSMGMLLVYYGHHSEAIDARIIAARPEFLAANTAHGLWAAVHGKSDSLLRNVPELQSAGIRVLGYLTSGYGGTGTSGTLDPLWYALDTNKQFITSMAELDRVDGIFADECPAYPDEAQKEYCRELAAFAHDSGLTVWGNVGESEFDPWYLSDGGYDLINTTEQWDGSATTVQEDWGPRISVISAGGSPALDEAVSLARDAHRSGLAFCYVTNSYTELPSWLDAYAGYLRNPEKDG